MFLFVGDDLYPENPDYFGTEDSLNVNETLEKNRNNCNRLNRSEFRPGNTTLVHCNIADSGHIPPVFPPEIFKTT